SVIVLLLSSCLNSRVSQSRRPTLADPSGELVSIQKWIEVLLRPRLGSHRLLEERSGGHPGQAGGLGGPAIIGVGPDDQHTLARDAHLRDDFLQHKRRRLAPLEFIRVSVVFKSRCRGRMRKTHAITCRADLLGGPAYLRLGLLFGLQPESHSAFVARDCVSHCCSAATDTILTQFFQQFDTAWQHSKRLPVAERCVGQHTKITENDEVELVQISSQGDLSFEMDCCTISSSSISRGGMQCRPRTPPPRPEPTASNCMLSSISDENTDANKHDTVHSVPGAVMAARDLLAAALQLATCRISCSSCAMRSCAAWKVAGRATCLPPRRLHRCAMLAT